MESQLDLISESLNAYYSCWVHEALDGLPHNFTITDPSVSGHPIVYASRGFLKISGYTKEEVVGRNGRMFQGPSTNRRTVMEVREAIRGERAIQVSLLNYRKDGAAFWMLFHMSPVFSKVDGRVLHFIAVQVPMRRKRCLGIGFGGTGTNLCEGRYRLRETVYGSCRQELCSDSSAEFGSAMAREVILDMDDGDVEGPCEASDFEKQYAASAINDILSLLMCYSESTGREVCEKRCSLSGAGLLGSSFMISLGRIKQSFVLTNPYSSDMPIVYASDAFLRLSGYARHEVLGRNCRFLSGADTDSSTLKKIDESIQNKQQCTVRILNYRKDNGSFWNLLHISPICNALGMVTYVVEVYTEEGCIDVDEQGWSVRMKQLSVVGAVRVAARSLSMAGGPSGA